MKSLVTACPNNGHAFPSKDEVSNSIYDPESNSLVFHSTLKTTGYLKQGMDYCQSYGAKVFSQSTAREWFQLKLLMRKFGPSVLCRRGVGGMGIPLSPQPH